jgi:hypothetical protein
MPRYAISHHTGAREGDHYDFFVEQGDVLKTWRLENPSLQHPQKARQIRDHRKTYLEFEGDLTDRRGRVKLWDAGECAVEEWTDRRIRLALRGRRTRLRVVLERAAAPEGTAEEPLWTVADAAAEVRRAAAGILEAEPPGLAPTPDLDLLREALLGEERRLMAQVDLFSRGQDLEWEGVRTDPDVRRRLDAERARWQHPWLTAARAYAAALDGLARKLLELKPAAS